MLIRESHCECSQCGRNHVSLTSDTQARTEWMDMHMSVHHPAMPEATFAMWETQRTPSVTVLWPGVPPVMDRAGLQDMTFPKPDAQTIVVTDTIPIDE